MRRFVLILLIALLPLQSVWAAAADASLNGGSPASAHFGHHDHPQAAPSDVGVDDGTDAAGDTSGSADDGATTHAHCCPAITADSDSVVARCEADTAFSPYARVVRDHIPENPLRPPRAALA